MVCSAMEQAYMLIYILLSQLLGRVLYICLDTFSDIIKFNQATPFWYAKYYI